MKDERGRDGLTKWKQNFQLWKMWDVKFFFSSFQTFLHKKYNNNFTCKSVTIKRGETCHFTGVVRREWCGWFQKQPQRRSMRERQRAQV